MAGVRPAARCAARWPSSRSRQVPDTNRVDRGVLLRIQQSPVDLAASTEALVDQIAAGQSIDRIVVQREAFALADDVTVPVHPQRRQIVELRSLVQRAATGDGRDPPSGRRTRYRSNAPTTRRPRRCGDCRDGGRRWATERTVRTREPLSLLISYHRHDGVSLVRGRGGRTAAVLYAMWRVPPRRDRADRAPRGCRRRRSGLGRDAHPSGRGMGRADAVDRGRQPERPRRSRCSHLRLRRRRPSTRPDAIVVAPAATHRRRSGRRSLPLRPSRPPRCRHCSTAMTMSSRSRRHASRSGSRSSSSLRSSVVSPR